MTAARKIGIALTTAFVGVAALSGCTPHTASPLQGNSTQTSQVSTNLDDITVSTEKFEPEVLKSPKPVLVDFYAEGCHYCQQVAPAVKEIAREKADSLKVVGVDVRASPDLASEYRAFGTPTFLIFRDGTPIAEAPGAAPKDALVKWIDDSLALPTGTKLDLTPKTLSGDDKKRLREAFESAVNKRPDADIPQEGSQTTLRQAVEKELDSGAIFKDAEKMLNTSPITVDQLIAQAQNATFTIPKQAPQP